MDRAEDFAAEDRDEHFDDLEAEPEDGPPPCTACGHEIESTYYVLSQQPLCPSCRDVILQGQFGGSRVARFLKALILGGAAGIAAAVLYYMILRFTGRHFGLIAIVVGLMVGGAVRKGSEGRGGLFYQLLAMFLTYTAIAATNIPDIVKMIHQQVQVQAAAKPAQAKKAAAQIAKEPPLVLAGKALVAVFMLLALILIIAYAWPIVAAFHGGGFLLLLLAFGLWEAWKINRRAVPPIEGPYSLDGDDLALAPTG